VAPVSGYVTAKEVYAGQQVEPGMELFTVTDLGSVWVEAQLYEYEAPLVRTGQAASIALPYDPAYAREGKVAYVYPYLDESTRTLAVRLDVPNPDLALKPGMYASVRLDLETGKGVVVPDDAVLSTGERQIVYVERQPGLYDPRLVRTGLRGDGRVLILSGVAAGERVVVRANFLLDSESRLRAAIAGADSARQSGGPQ
jgi:RND family efflux transporter MFP subunit